MKKASLKTIEPKQDDMATEYDLKTMKGGVRGKYYKAYRAGHVVRIHKTDGTTIVQSYKPIEGAIVIAPDLKKYFPDSEAVNEALRCLVPLIAKRRKLKIRA